MTSSWLRCRKDRPCQVCGRPDWCSVTSDGKAAHCMRVASGKELPKGGWIHKLDGSVKPITYSYDRPPAPLTPAELAIMSRQFQAGITTDHLAAFAGKMGLSPLNLKRLNIGWNLQSRAWTFPMTNSKGDVLGIRLRTDDGKKFAVRGGREGLFIPESLTNDGPLCLPEGPTSTCALLDMDLDAVGRPSCSGGTDLLISLLPTWTKRDVAIFADHDEQKHRPDGSIFYPGQEGGKALANKLLASKTCKSVKIICPPRCKDARDWKALGANKRIILSAVWAANYCN